MADKGRVAIVDLFSAPIGGTSKNVLYAELGKDWRLEDVGDKPDRLMRLACLARTFQPSRGRWAEAYYDAYNRALFRTSTFRSFGKAYRRSLQRRRGSFDLVLQVGCLFEKACDDPGVAYCTYHDSNVTLARRSWPAMVPFFDEPEADAYVALERASLSRVDRVMTYSEWTRRSFIEDYGLPAEKVVRVGSALKFSAMSDEPKDYDGKTVLFVGRDLELKGARILLEAMVIVRRAIPDARLTFLGPHPDCEPSLLENVDVVSPIKDRQAMKRLYQSATVLAHPALHDAYPSVLLEAMSLGVPCVASDICAIPEEIEDGVSGFLFPKGDVSALAEKIVTLLSDKALCAAMGEVGRRHVREVNSPSVVAANIDRAFGDAMELARARRAR